MSDTNETITRCLNCPLNELTAAFMIGGMPLLTTLRCELETPVNFPVLIVEGTKRLLVYRCANGGFLKKVILEEN